MKINFYIKLKENYFLYLKNIFIIFLLLILLFLLNIIKIIKKNNIKLKFNYNELLKNYNKIYNLSTILNQEVIYNIKISDLNDLILKLNKYTYLRKPKYIIISDIIRNRYCNDFNGYYLFEYYIENNYSNIYYIINNDSDLYKTLLKKNKTNNLILYSKNFNWEVLFKFLLNSKIIIQSYTIPQFNKIINNVPYLKYLRINHGIRYFKYKFENFFFGDLSSDKRYMISSSPYEYELFIKKFNYSEKYIFKAGLPRYDRFKYIKKNMTEKKCILISFTWRTYNYTIYNKSLFKKNLVSLINNEYLIKILKNNNIDLIYIPHHVDILYNRVLSKTELKYAKKGTNFQLSHFIEKCSLIVTDFSSIAYDFMFQNKPVLFYLIDLKENFDFEEKDYMKNKNNIIYFGNSFEDEDKLIERIQYYINKQFNIGNDLRKKYNSVFFYKDNIRKRIFDIVNTIIEK